MNSRRNLAANGRTSIEAAAERARRDGIDSGRRREKSRIMQILWSSEAVGRDKLAQHLALDTDMTAVAAREELARASTGGAKVVAAPSTLAEEMRKRFSSKSNKTPNASGPEDSQPQAGDLVSGMRARFDHGASR